MTADVTSVRTLIKSVTKLVEYLDGEVTPNAVYRWIKVNRIPGKYMLRIAQFYDIHVPIHLAESDKKNDTRIVTKPRETLPVCLQVQNGSLSVTEAAEQLGLHPQAVNLILKNWGAQLQLLYDTLVRLENKEMSLDQAALALGVTKYNVHALRKKYGFAPQPRPKAPERPIVKRRKVAEEVALACIAGKMTLSEVENHCDLSWRTIHRTISKLSPDYTMIDLTHWPKALREAYSQEIRQECPKISAKLWKWVENNGVSLKKQVKYPKIPSNWRTANARRMMVHVLLGDETVDSIAASRSADPFILESIFNSDLRPLDLTWGEVVKAPMLTQIGLAEVLIAIDDQSKTPRMRAIERIKDGQ